MTDLPPTPSKAQLAAGFDVARQLRDPDFRARLAAASVGPDNPVVVVLPDDTITAVLDRLDEPGPALIAIPDGTDPHGYRLAAITRHPEGRQTSEGGPVDGQDPKAAQRGVQGAGGTDRDDLPGCTCPNLGDVPPRGWVS